MSRTTRENCQLGDSGRSRAKSLSSNDLNGPPIAAPIKVRFTRSHITRESARWEQAFSADGGKTWETNWVQSLTRVK